MLLLLKAWSYSMWMPLSNGTVWGKESLTFHFFNSSCKGCYFLNSQGSQPFVCFIYFPGFFWYLAEYFNGYVIGFYHDVYVLLDPDSALSYVSPYEVVNFGFCPKNIHDPSQVLPPLSSLLWEGSIKIILWLSLIEIL